MQEVLAGAGETGRVVAGEGDTCSQLLLGHLAAPPHNVVVVLTVRTEPLVVITQAWYSGGGAEVFFLLQLFQYFIGPFLCISRDRYKNVHLLQTNIYLLQITLVSGPDWADLVNIEK